MKYEDLSDYCHMLPKALSGVINVGWLDGSVFPRGSTSPDFRYLLAQLIARGPVNQVRSVDPCAVCGQSEVKLVLAGKELLLGTAEVWVPSTSGDVIYAAPDLVWHYVEHHQYLPPVDFQKAITQFDFASTWSGQRTHEALVNQLFDKLS